MGITGLLPLIKPICQSKHVNHLASKRVGIDVYGWLHKGIFSCATSVCRGLSTTAYVDYCMYRVRMLVHFNIVPVLVFDGADLPMKADTHAERKSRRDDARAKADAAYAAGDLRRAEEFYQRACTVTSHMARLVIRECRKLNIEYIVAPYEADAQLAWLLMRGHIAAVITEDSDLLAYGAHTVFYKMTRTGDGDLFDRARLPSLDTISLTNFTDDMFIFMCVCAGCDFFKGVPGLGLRKSHPIVRRARTLPRLVHVLRAKYRVSPTFTADFTRAYLVFRHQTVYDVDARKTVALTDLCEVVRAGLPPGALPTLDDGSLDLAFLGKLHDPDTARKVATAQIHPRTLCEYDEPLDVVQRTPTLRRARNSHFPAPTPPRSQRNVQDDGGAPQLPVRGFAVQPASQPASSTQNASYTPTKNLRNRLGGTAGTSFNPRQAARAFNRTNGTLAQPEKSRPVAPQSLAVWARFRPASTIKQSDTSLADATGDTTINAEKERASAQSLTVPPPSLPKNQTTRQKQHGDRTAMTDRTDTERGDRSAREVMGEQEANRDCIDSISPDGTQAVNDPTQSPDYLRDLRSSSVSMGVEYQEVEDAVTPVKAVEAEIRPEVTLSGGDEPYLNDDGDGCNFRQLYTNNFPSPHQANASGASSHRVEALDRMVGKFARAERDERLKFVRRAKKPPSPSREAYNLFEQMEADLSRDGVKTKEQPVAQPATPAKLRQTGLSAKTLGKKSPITSPIMDGDPARRRKSSDQLLVSRFFASSNNTAAKPSSLKVKAPGLKRRRSSLSGAGAPKNQKTSVLNLDRFRRGSSSKKAVPKDTKR